MNPKGQEVPPVWACEPFSSVHTFDCSPPTPLVCEEVLYASDTSTESHYQRSHPKNAGAEKIAEIIVDFDFLRLDGLIQPIEGGVDENGKWLGKRHYRVEFTMVIKVVDRDLQCEPDPGFFSVYNALIDVSRFCHLRRQSQDQVQDQHRIGFPSRGEVGNRIHLVCGAGNDTGTEYFPRIETLKAVSGETLATPSCMHAFSRCIKTSTALRRQSDMKQCLQTGKHSPCLSMRICIVI